MSSIVINKLTFIHPDGSTLFRNLSFTFGNDKIGLVGNNGSGKSTLAKIIAGIIQPSAEQDSPKGILWEKQLQLLQLIFSIIFFDFHFLTFLSAAPELIPLTQTPA